MGFYEDDRIRHKNAVWNKLIEGEKVKSQTEDSLPKVQNLEEQSVNKENDK